MALRRQGWPPTPNTHSLRSLLRFRSLQLRSFPRKRESRSRSHWHWVPAFAGTNGWNCLNWLPPRACPTMRARSSRAALGRHPQALQRYALAVLSHIGLVAAWYLFVKFGEVPKFVMPSPYDTVHALLVPNYRWPENIAVTTVEIFAGYIL